MMTDLKAPNIDANEWYAYTTVINNKWIPWIKHKNTLKGMLETKEGKKLYKPIVRVAGNKTFYRIKGSTLIEVIGLSDKGLLRI